MTAASSTRTDPSSATAGLLIIRVWVEPGHPTALRARIIRSGGGSENGSGGREAPMTSRASATVEDTLNVVRAWLEEFAAD